MPSSTPARLARVPRYARSGARRLLGLSRLAGEPATSPRDATLAVAKGAAVRVPASSANLGPGFDVLALALDLHLTVEARESAKTTIGWEGQGAAEVPLNRKNLIAHAAQEPFAGWSRPLDGLELRVQNDIPIGRGLGRSTAAIIAGITLGARLRGLRMPAQRILELAVPLEGHGDNVAAEQAGALGAALSGAGGSVVAIADQNLAKVGSAMSRAAGSHGIKGKVATLKAATRGASQPEL